MRSKKAREERRYRLAVAIVLTWVTALTTFSACVDQARLNDASSSTADGNTDTTTGIPSNPAAPVPGGTGNTPVDATIAEQILEETNAYRMSNGVAALTLNPKLSQAAQDFAEAMATQGFFSHTGLDGSTVGTRIAAAGYRFSTWGENIAYGYTSVDQAMAGWIGSSGHRANILNGNFKELGVGYFVKSNGTAYWVQDFGSP